ncbi:MAG: radical SAM protein [Nitrososphaerota archaeon]|nr:radical SAM protein [Nitrososphaerota archaeon]
MTSPFVKRMLALSIRRCDGCGGQVLDIALDKYVGSDTQKCKKCSFPARVIIFWVEFLRRSLAIERQKVEKILADPYARRGIKSVVKTFLYFGVKKPLTVYAPFLVVWDYTYKCNLRCRHCYSNAGASAMKELNTEEALNVVDQLADFGVVSLAFSGGEPLMRKDFFEVAKHAVDSGLYVSLATNGTLLNKQTAQKLKKTGIHYVEISVDGSDAKLHDEFRGVPGAFELAITGLKNCVGQGLCASVAVTATKKNFKDIPKILELSEKIGAKRFVLFNFVPTGRGVDVVSQDLSPKEREEVMLFLLDRLLSGSKVAILTTTPQLARVAVSHQRGVSDEVFLPMAHMQTSKVSKKAVALADFIGGCGAGRLYCSISPEGDVHPCVFLPIKIGNLKTDNFGELWLHSEMFQALRNRENLKGSCGTCSFKYICGGCRARAYAYTRDFLAPDPGCILVEECT